MLGHLVGHSWAAMCVFVQMAANSPSVQAVELLGVWSDLCVELQPHSDSLVESRRMGSLRTSVSTAVRVLSVPTVPAFSGRTEKGSAMASLWELLSHPWTYPLHSLWLGFPSLKWSAVGWE